MLFGKTHLELIANVRADAPGPSWSTEVADYRPLEKDAFGPNQHVVITPISDASSTERALVDVDVPAISLAGLNPRQLEDLASSDRKQSDVALATLRHRNFGRNRAEIISTVVSASERFTDDAPDTHKIP